MNKKANEINKRLIANNKFSYILKKYRKILNIPSDGFKNKEQWEKEWMDKVKKININEKSISSHPFTILKKYYQEIYENFPYVDEEWSMVLDDYIFRNETKRHLTVNTTGCKLIPLLNGQKQLEEGMYIKIGIDSNKSDIKKFLKSKLLWIEFLQKTLKDKNKTPKKKRIRTSKYYDRDYFIYYLNKMDKKWLEKNGGGDSNYKDIQISNILEKQGHNVTPDNVRKIISRQKKLIEK